MAAISFDHIPAQLRVPGFYIEINNELAGGGAFMSKVLLFGQRLATGTVAAGQPIRVTSAEQGETWFGRGSMLAQMLRAFKRANQFTETWVIAQDDNPAGVQASGTVSIRGTVTQAGTINLYIAGQRIQVGVKVGDDDYAVADKLLKAVQKDTALPLTAARSSLNGRDVSLTARHAGLCGNDIDLRLNYYTGEQTPAGLTVTLTAMADGTANPDIKPAIAALGDEWWNYIVMPYTDAANLRALENELDSRYQPPLQRGGRAFTAYRGTHSATGTFGESRNSAHVSCIGTGIAPEPPYIWAAVNAAVGAQSLSNDPARPLQRLTLPHLKPPKLTDRWDWNERNLLLFDGIATWTVDSGGTIRIERQITMYQKNSADVADAAYLDITTPETLERIRFDKVQRISSKYPRHKLREDGELNNIPAGAAIATPAIIKAELLAIYESQINKAWVEGLEDYKQTLVVMIGDGNGGGDRNRVNVNDQPNIVNQFRIFAAKTQFRL